MSDNNILPFRPVAVSRLFKELKELEDNPPELSREDRREIAEKVGMPLHQFDNRFTSGSGSSYDHGSVS